MVTPPGGGGGGSPTWGPSTIMWTDSFSVNLVLCSLRSLAVLSNLNASAQSSEAVRNYFPGSMRLWRFLSRPRFPNAFKLLKNHQAT